VFDTRCNHQPLPRPEILVALGLLPGCPAKVGEQRARPLNLGGALLASAQMAVFGRPRVGEAKQRVINLVFR
jgi:hypothetical protein